MKTEEGKEKFVTLKTIHKNSSGFWSENSHLKIILVIGDYGRVRIIVDDGRNEFEYNVEQDAFFEAVTFLDENE